MSETKRKGGQGETWTWSASAATNTVRLTGEIDFTVSPIVRDKLASFVEQTRGDVFLDLGDLEYIDSSGLAALIEGRQMLKARGQDHHHGGLASGPQAVRADRSGIFSASSGCFRKKASGFFQ